MTRVNCFTILFGCTLLSACASTTGVDKAVVADPYESFNRPVHKFNSKVDTYIAKPVADGYRRITPDFLQKGVNNFFNNLQEVNVILNDLLQAKFRQGAQDIGRLTLNSTLGLGGLIDVASKAGLDKHNEDFGQTLAVWGVPQGNYLVLPFVGPSTLRELPGYVVDAAANPGTYFGGAVALPLASVNALNTRANAEGSLQFINEAALDPYVFMRESYLQWRNYQAADGQVKSDKALDDFEGELLDEEGAAKTSVSTTKTEPTGMPKAEGAPEKSVQTQKPTYEEARKTFEKSSLKLEALRNKKQSGAP